MHATDYHPDVLRQRASLLAYRAAKSIAKGDRETSARESIAARSYKEAADAIDYAESQEERAGYQLSERGLPMIYAPDTFWDRVAIIGLALLGMFTLGLWSIAQ
jgi:hypothetical protein